MTGEMEFRYEKFGAITLARWFERRGYEVRLSVPGPIADLARDKDLGGLVPPDLSQQDFDDPQCRYEIYYDSPGNIDFVARKGSELWLVEAKGLIKRGGAPAAVAQAIGQIILMMDPSYSNVKYGVLLPREKRFEQVMEGISAANPLLSRDDVFVFWVTGDGEIEGDRIDEIGHSQ